MVKMKKLTLIRRSTVGDATAGLLFDDHFFSHTMELRWNNNEPYNSCIPEGNYIVNPDTTGDHKYFIVTNVTGRTGIEIHPANHPEELKGCIALGRRFIFFGDPERYVLKDSEAACFDLHNYMYNTVISKVEPFELTIKNLRSLV